MISDIKSTNIKCICTPINTVSKYVSSKTKIAREDYYREQRHFEEDSEFNPKWDDSPGNTATIGDKFAFVQNIRNSMEIFSIIGIISIEDRPDYWDIPEHQRRRVLILSKKENTITFSFYKEQVGYSQNFRSRGTKRLAWCSNLIV
jgi:hypothetical protein